MLSHASLVLCVSVPYQDVERYMRFQYLLEVKAVQV
jgi:hypothetical protein